MFQSVIVVCIGNVCRSPVGEKLLSDALPKLKISSAGLHALVGEPANSVTCAAAADRGIDLSGHVARQFTSELGVTHDLILVMEKSHRTEIAQRFPYLVGRTMLFAQWLKASPDVDDPYRKPREAHDQTVALICSAAQAWAARLA